MVFENQTIFRIQLTDEQFKQAQNSNIRKYLNEQKKQIMVVEDVVYTESEQIEVLAALKASSGLNIGEAGKKGFPSYEKCVAIMNWICDNDLSGIINSNSQRKSHTNTPYEIKPFDNAEQGYEMAYKAHYSEKNLEAAYLIYKKVMEKYPDSNEAKWAGQQIENIKKVVDVSSIIDKT